METRIESRWWSDYRFSISGLMAVILVLSGCLGWLANTAHVQRGAVAAIHAAGGGVSYEGAWEDSTWWPPNFLLDRLGIDFFDRVASVYLSDAKSADAAMPWLAQLHSLRELYLGGSSLSDRGLSQIKGLTRLVSLDLSGTAISDDGLAAVEGIRRLRDLNLAQTKIGDAGLSHLTTLKDLSRLNVSKTLVTADGARAFARAQRRMSIRLH
jgi:hypothetical protein